MTGEAMKSDTCDIGMRLAALTLSLVLLGLPAQRAAAEIDPIPEPDLILEVRVEKERVYLGETVSTTVTFLAGQISVRNVQYPVIEGDAFRLSEFSAPRSSTLIRGGRAYTAYEFTATLKPLKSGKLQFGPAELGVDLVERGGGAAAYFGGEEPRHIKVRSSPAGLAVLPLPSVGQPADFNGAVGRFKVSRQAAPQVIHSGEPLTVTTRIAGTGSADGFSCAPLELPGVRSYPPRTRRTSSTLNCEQVLVPNGKNELFIPPAAISYFDPHDGRYRSVQSESARIKIKNVRGTERPVTVTPNPLSSDGHARRREDTGYSFLPIALAAGALLLSGMLVYVMRYARVRHKLPIAAHTGDTEVEEWLAEVKNALASSDPERFYNGLYRVLQAHMGAEFGLATNAITGDIVTKVLQPAGVEEQLLHDCAKLFFICDRARFSHGGNSAASMQDAFHLLERVMQMRVRHRDQPWRG